MQHWDRDPLTGDYVMEGGAPLQTDSLQIPAFIRLKSHRKEWIYAKDAKFGSDLFKVLMKNNSSVPALVESLAARAVQPIVDDGRASAITVDTSVRGKLGVGLNVKIQTAQGEQEEIEFLPVGG